MNTQDYRKYLQSKHWKKFSAEVYRLVPTCPACAVSQKTYIYHLRQNLYKETLLDVVVLCRDCYEAMRGSASRGFSKEQWIKLHCKDFYELQVKHSPTKKVKQQISLLERARREALRHYKRQGQTIAVSEVRKYAPNARDNKGLSK